MTKFEIYRGVRYIGMTDDVVSKNIGTLVNNTEMGSNGLSVGKISITSFY